MSFGGSVAAMLASLRHNKRERTSVFDKDRKEETPTNSYGKLEDHTKMEPYAFNQFKKSLESKAKKEKRINQLALLIISVLVIGMLGYILYFA